MSVREDRTGHEGEALVHTEKDQLRMEWGTREQERYTGWPQVAGIGSGASEVTIHLTFSDESQVPADDIVERALDASLNRLGELVGARVSDAG